MTTTRARTALKPNPTETVTVQHIWCAHCKEPYTVPLNFQGCPVCQGTYCTDETSCVEVEKTETINVLEWRRRVRAGCMSNPVTDGGDTLNMIDRAIDKCQDLLSHVQSGQSDPTAYELAHDLLRLIEGLNRPTADLVMTAREMKAEPQSRNSTRTATTGPVTVYKAATEWGTGQTTCFACDQAFTYQVGEPVDALRAIDLCDQNCTPGSHKGNCTALGGDLCPTCAEQANNRPISFAMNLVLSATRQERRAKQMTEYARAVAYAATPDISSHE